ncbi:MULTISPECIES: flagellar type III secretion system pore protein FliP [Ponticaulis]|jgi:flagellar biosynthetic protein FliP|uniref:flagellar type III secretion system pore protein FliP n=1 Tax=Ponticaulis TaxID=1123044 RepID=UPI0003B2EAD9|nr:MULTISPECIES: flagellar type III secretion system pore protein FliP [Ponticaulis]MAJ08599.1 flagellar biosynthetic protein FliP [Ponticaulis sp.]MBN04330.1 flagellar biosynthetic protein FliP [Ponticaulis sp.]HBJ92557.1 flagellar biosynthetic protein FliP [Hyphomonadaceae bacterium]|tara:strand:+ start:35168 stop:35917 length:750 start_codon:yes stop_codon:yes gene_type:complete
MLRITGLLILGLIAAAGLPALAQEVTVDLGTGAGLNRNIVQLIAIITVLSLAPSILVMTTSFVRIVVVLSLLRTAIGLQQSPPNAVIISLSLFLTGFVMAPTFGEAYQSGIAPYMSQAIDVDDAIPRTLAPVKAFMGEHVNETDLELFVGFANLETLPDTAAEMPFEVLAPAFMISELKRAFEIGFMIFLPFLIIDLVVASILMSMGMMMLPPVTISLPFKLIFFVLVDGWRLLTGSLVESFIAGPPVP